MRSEHPMSGDEYDFFTGWRKVMHKPTVRRLSKRLKQMSHRTDRRNSRQRNWMDEH